MVFVRRTLETEARTLGERLRLLRRTQAVSMDMLVDATRIQRKYLEALEWGNYHHLPDPLYTRNFIRAYARYLGADETYFLELFAREVARSDLLAPHRLPRRRVRSIFFLSFPQVITAGVIVSVFFLGIFWLYSRIVVVFLPPEIVVQAPAYEEIVHTPWVRVVGEVKNKEASVRIGESTIPLAPDGSFTLEVPLRVGPNRIAISARSQYSSAYEEVRTVVYVPLDVDN